MCTVTINLERFPLKQWNIKKKLKKRREKKEVKTPQCDVNDLNVKFAFDYRDFTKKKKKKFVGKLSRPLHLYIKIVHFCIYIYAIQDNLLFLALDCTIFQYFNNCYIMVRYIHWRTVRTSSYSTYISVENHYRLYEAHSYLRTLVL